MRRSKLTWRDRVKATDPDLVRRMCAGSGFFHREEVEIAGQLVEERLAKGLDSGYHFLFAELDDSPLGYACYGPIPATASSWDLYWIVVWRNLRGQGIGRLLLAEVERRVIKAGGRRIYVDTSSGPKYAPTRGFYEGRGYVETARLEDFYAPEDDKVIFVKVVGVSRRKAAAERSERVGRLN